MTGPSCDGTLRRHNPDASPNRPVGVGNRDVMTKSSCGDTLRGHNLGASPNRTIGSSVGERTRMTIGGRNGNLTDWDSRLHLSSGAARRARDEGSIVN